eukprot:15353015-Ditylum_brightwellii.AAC.1
MVHKNSTSSKTMLTVFAPGFNPGDQRNKEERKIVGGKKEKEKKKRWKTGEKRKLEVDAGSRKKMMVKKTVSVKD